jgi:hypothetical protein
VVSGLMPVEVAELEILILTHRSDYLFKSRLKVNAVKNTVFVENNS